MHIANNNTSKFERYMMLVFGICTVTGLIIFGRGALPEVAVKSFNSDVVASSATATEARTAHSLTFRIAGDFMFARGVHRKFNEVPSLSLDKIGTDFFGNADASIVNLEGAISATSLQEIVQKGSFTFIFPSTAISVLKEHNINTVSLANNHSFNDGLVGFINTQRLLADNEINYFGGPTGKYTPEVSIIQGENLNLVAIGVHTLYETPDITSIIKKYKKNKDNRILIMPHWGEEYQFRHNQRQEQLAHSWVDAGADIIVGSHPHVVQDVEVYKGVPIVYSLGNFLFDQTEQNTGEKGVQDGMTIHGKFIKDKLAIYGVPIEIRNFQPQVVANSDKGASILKDFYTPWSEYAATINGIEMFVF